MHGVSGGLMSELDGGKFISGFASGAISSMISSGIGKLGPKTDANGNIIKEGVLNASDTKAMMIVGGGLSGGISSSIAGGDFMKGMQQGLITSGLNHARHMATSGWDQDPPKKTYNAMTSEGRGYSDMKETLIPINEFLIDATLAIESAKGLRGAYIYC